MTQEFKIKPLTKKLQRFIMKNPEIVKLFKKVEIKYLAMDTTRDEASLFLRISGFNKVPYIAIEKIQSSPWRYPMWGIDGFMGFLTENAQSLQVLSLGLGAGVLYEITPGFIQSLQEGGDNV